MGSLVGSPGRQHLQQMRWAVSDASRGPPPKGLPVGTLQIFESVTLSRPVRGPQVLAHSQCSINAGYAATKYP